MRFAIRDDDTCYFTRPEELEKLWGRFLPYVPVSLAVTPFALECFHLGDLERFYQGSAPQALSGNPELVDWLARNMSRGRVTVMCHGYTHEYRRMPDGRLVQEYIWKDKDRLERETQLGKRHLEDVLGRPVSTFVPPGNGISRAAIEAVRPSFQNVLATFPLRRWEDVRFNREYLVNYVRRLYFQLRHGLANPTGGTVAGVRLIPSVSVTRLVDWAELRAKFETVRRLNGDFVAAVHYWEVDDRIAGMIERLVDLATQSGCEFCHCPDLFRRPEAGRLELRHAGA